MVEDVLAYKDPAAAAEIIHDLSMSSHPEAAAYGRLMKQVNHGYWTWIMDEAERVTKKGGGDPWFLLAAFIRAQASLASMCFNHIRATSPEAFAETMAEGFKRQLVTYMKATDEHMAEQRRANKP